MKLTKQKLYKLIKEELSGKDLKKLADINDVADLVLYLISSKNHSITGECITIDYGSTS